MPGKQGGNKRGAPEGAGHPLQKKKEQANIDRVQNDIGQMMAARARPIDLPVKYMGNPGQRNPVA